MCILPGSFAWDFLSTLSVYPYPFPLFFFLCLAAFSSFWSLLRMLSTRAFFGMCVLHVRFACAICLCQFLGLFLFCVCLVVLLYCCCVCVCFLLRFCWHMFLVLRFLLARLACVFFMCSFVYFSPAAAAAAAAAVLPCISCSDAPAAVGC